MSSLNIVSIGICLKTLFPSTGQLVKTKEDNDDHGILIEIYDCHKGSGYKKGEVYFFNWDNLKFQILETIGDHNEL